jgi:hypothetical protein
VAYFAKKLSDATPTNRSQVSSNVRHQVMTLPQFDIKPRIGRIDSYKELELID